MNYTNIDKVFKNRNKCKTLHSTRSNQPYQAVTNIERKLLSTRFFLWNIMTLLGRRTLEIMWRETLDG